MALNNSKFKGGGKLLLLTPRSKDKNKQDVPPHFEIAHFEGDTVVKEDRTVNSVSGDLVRLEFVEKKYEDNVSEDAVFYFRDANEGENGETYRVPVRFGNTGRSLFNSFASLADGENFSGLQLDYYRSKSGYDRFGLTQNGNRVEWKFKLEELPQPLEIKHPTSGKVIQRDYSAVNAFLKAELQKIASKINKNASEKAKPDKAATPSSGKAAPDEDVPF